MDLDGHTGGKLLHFLGLIWWTAVGGRVGCVFRFFGCDSTVNLWINLLSLQDGMGQLKIVSGGIQLTGQAMVLDILRASSIRSKHGQPISIGMIESIWCWAGNSFQTTSFRRVITKLQYQHARLGRVFGEPALSRSRSVGSSGQSLPGSGHPRYVAVCRRSGWSHRRSHFTAGWRRRRSHFQGFHPDTVGPGRSRKGFEVSLYWWRETDFIWI